MRGINLGNAFDGAPGEEPRLRVTGTQLDAVRAAGFDTLRIPVRWSAHAAPAAPFTIDPALFARVDAVVDGALDRGFTVLLDLHHYHELQAAPVAHGDRFLGLWRQLAARYAGHPAGLVLELLNEPRDALTPAVWNRLLARAHAVVRAADPDRRIVVGPARMHDLGALSELELPDDDRLLVTVHYYAPMAFTHQGAAWTPGSAAWLGTTWGSTVDEEAVRRDLARVAEWGRRHRRVVFLGEFGAYERAELAARVRWLACVRAEAERLGLGWCAWDFGTDFGAYDPVRERWREPLLRALIPN